MDTTISEVPTMEGHLHALSDGTKSTQAHSVTSVSCLVVTRRVVYEEVKHAQITSFLIPIPSLLSMTYQCSLPLWGEPERAPH